MLKIRYQLNAYCLEKAKMSDIKILKWKGFVRDIRKMLLEKELDLLSPSSVAN